MCITTYFQMQGYDGFFFKLSKIFVRKYYFTYIYYTVK